MATRQITFSDKTVSFYFDAAFEQLNKIVSPDSSVIITDENIFRSHRKKFSGWDTIILKPGEEYKIQLTADTIIETLIEKGADRTFTLIGVGGGVVTDITGYVASVYMRGISFGFVPTSILAMVDASIGGKNGIDVGIYKNMVGVIRQPDFLLYDYNFLKSLPQTEWQNGFAEIIKHAAILDAAMFKQLEQNKLSNYKKDKKLLSALIQKNALIKCGVVQEDEFEKGNRKLLNFGHTLAHAIENTYELSHGQAVAIGMAAAAVASSVFTKFKDTERLINLIEKYQLPAFAQFDAKKALVTMRSDKKKSGNAISYILLERIGKAVIKPLTIEELQPVIERVAS
ncbi:MAG: 3-dehydroquinate synthase [Chitinophagaceae bacterium]|nr:3-dehydroquinate synthase [Chitinophagaceae bacterium]